MTVSTICCIISIVPVFLLEVYLKLMDPSSLAQGPPDVELFLTIHFETLASSKTVFIIGNQTRISKGLALSSWLKLIKRHVLSGKPMDATNQEI